MALTDKLTALGDAIRGKTELTDKMTIDQMTEAITNLEVNPAPNVEEITITNNGTYIPNEGVDGFNRVIVNVPVDLGDLPEDLLHLSGNIGYRFHNDGWTSFINKYGSQITTENISSVNRTFEFCEQLFRIPFDLNCNSDSDSDFDSCFHSSSIEELPVINVNKIGSMAGMCDDCQRLRYINLDFNNIDISNVIDSDFKSEIFFNECRSLRELPQSFLDKLKKRTVSKRYYSSVYKNFTNLYNLDTVSSLPVMVPDIYTSNVFGDYSGKMNLYRIKDFIFQTQEDNTPYSANWKSQIIDLSNAGYNLLSGTYYKRDNDLYNSGITIDKCIYNDETYQALKDDPDSYVAGYSNENPHYYSRYDKASAIRTINSLPDASASGGTNTIKFKGEAGLRTDGGAINTMTEEEIAVATAKGWTVSFV